jgi:hypothetical protein
VVTSSSVKDSTGAVSVPGPITGSGGGLPGGGGAADPGGFTLSPVIGSIGVIGSPGSQVGSIPATNAGLPGAAADPALGTPGTPQNLSYPSDDPLVGKSSALALKVNAGRPRTDVVPVAVLALGILILAIAAHFLYLRVELGVIQARLGSGRGRES